MPGRVQNGLHEGDSRPATRTIILAISGLYELWCISTCIEPKVLGRGLRFLLAADLRFRAQSTSPEKRGPTTDRRRLPGRGRSFVSRHREIAGTKNEYGIRAGGRVGSGGGKSC